MYSKLTIRRIVGAILIISSFLLWGVVAAIPFFNFSKVFMAGAITVLLVISEVIFWLGVILLGKELWDKFKSKINLKRFWHNFSKSK